MDINSLRRALAAKGYRNTPQRESVLRAVLEAEKKEEHMTVEEVFQRARRHCADIGLATVYRTLQLLTELGLVERSYLAGDIVRYELAHEDEPHCHHHMLCTECGSITEVRQDLLAAIERMLKTRYDFEVTGHTVSFSGICAECRAKKKE